MQAEAPPGTIRDGLRDIVAGIKSWPIWWTLTWYSIRSQYRRTYIGPWWMTLQQVIFVAGLSLVFGLLFQQDLTTFVPYVAIGYIAFSWMTGMIVGGAGSIVGNAGVDQDHTRTVEHLRPPQLRLQHVAVHARCGGGRRSGDHLRDSDHVVDRSGTGRQSP